MFRVNVCVCVCSAGRNSSRCIVSTIRRERRRLRRRRRRREEKRHERKEESSSDDHISVAADIVYHCLLKLDIFRSRHVLGKRVRTKRERERDDTHTKRRGLRKKVRDYGRSLLSQRKDKRRKGLFLLILLQHEHVEY